MPSELAHGLYMTGRAHALSAELLWRASHDEAKEKGINDIDKFVFNGPYSLTTFYLISLGLELMLKSAYVVYSGQDDEKHLRSMGHDLVLAFDEATAAGFSTQAVGLHPYLVTLRDPYLKHWFRYERPNTFGLPADFVDLVNVVAILDEELEQLFSRH